VIHRCKLKLLKVRIIETLGKIVRMAKIAKKTSDTKSKPRKQCALGQLATIQGHINQHVT
jgi:hypothetical protein